MSVWKSIFVLLLATQLRGAGDEASGSPWASIPTSSSAENREPVSRKDHPHGEALAELFALGLPDPKGLPYHVVSLQVWKQNGEEVSVATEAWLLPERDGTRFRFALAWNGLIYPIKELGKAIALVPQASKEEGPGGMRVAHDEAAEILPHQRTFIRYAYLSRLGFEKEADKIANHKSFQRYENFFKAAADEWAWNACARAIEAFRRGDDARAFASISQFRAIQSRLPEEMRYKPGADRDWLGGLASQAEHLESECKRRLGNKPVSEEAFLAGDPDIEALIHRLDELRFIQFHHDSIHPVVDALVAIGDNAIEPLLVCLENDRRLTRHVQIWKDWAPNRHIYTVRQTAHYILGRILKDTAMQRSMITNYRDYTDDAYFSAIADRIRADWKKHGSTDRIDRNLSILGDDDTTPRQWADAAEAFVDPKCLEGDLLFVATGELPNPGRNLDDDQQDTIAPLITARIEELLGAEEDQRFRNTHPLKSLYLSLWTWDRDQGEKALLKLIPKGDEPLTDAMTSDDALAQLLFKLENRSAAAFQLLECSMASKRPESYMTELADHYPLRVILRNAASPPYVELFNKLQNDPESAWNLSTTHEKSLKVLVAAGMQAKGMDRQFFRETLLTILQGRDPGFATISRLIEEPDILVYQGKNDHRLRVPEENLTGIRPGASISLRRADIAARAMADDSRSKIPFELYWSEEKRDEAIDKFIAAILKKMAIQ